MNTKRINSKNLRGGFTVVELLVSIAIIFILIAAAAFALRTAKRNAARTESLNALRQMVAAYNAYSSENKGRLMPGYIDQNEIWTDPTQATPAGKMLIQAKLESGFVLSPADTSSYVWRLAPYLDHHWKTFFTDYRSPGLEGKLVNEYGSGSGGGVYGPDGASAPQLGIASVPSYGLNSLFLGGDSYHATLGSLAPWKVVPGTKPLAATRLSEVKNPAKVVVFAPSSRRITTGIVEDIEPSTEAVVGYCELRAPMWHNQASFNDLNGTSIDRQWQVDAENRVEMLGPTDAGVPIDRLGDNKIPVGRLDGSTETEFIERLGADMSRWSPFVVSQN